MSNGMRINPKGLPLHMQEQVGVAIAASLAQAAPVAAALSRKETAQFSCTGSGNRKWRDADMTIDRYGFTETEVTAFQQRWNRSIRQDSTWNNFDDFLAWAGTAGYSKGARIYKIDESKPFGPDNAYFYRGRILTVKEAAAHEKPEVCRNCIEETTSCALYGCAMWKEWFVKNWNDNIHVDIPLAMRKPKKTVFQYEHPDLVREGLHENQN